MIFKIGVLILVLSIFYTMYFEKTCKYLKNYFREDTEDEFPRCMKNVFEDYDLQKSQHLAILGHVFDVSSKQDTYGLNGSYHFFTGKDASRAFATGDFSPKGLTADIQGLSINQIGEIFRWLLYINKKYKCIGHIPGLYFQMMGEYSDYMVGLIKAWKIVKNQNDVEEKTFPVCSFETIGDNIRFFCPNQKGNIQTYPRKLILSGTTKHRCTCLAIGYMDARVTLFDGCSFNSDSCLVPNK